MPILMQRLISAPPQNKFSLKDKENCFQGAKDCNALADSELKPREQDEYLFILLLNEFACVHGNKEDDGVSLLQKNQFVNRAF